MNLEDMMIVQRSPDYLFRQARDAASEEALVYRLTVETKRTEAVVTKDELLLLLEDPEVERNIIAIVLKDSREGRLYQVQARATDPRLYDPYTR